MSEFDGYRAVLPIVRPQRGVTLEGRDPDARRAPVPRLRPPDGAPNILLILLDDVGFGAPSAFGGPCQTPTAERLARAGLSFRRFHTAGLGSATRAALLSGRNHHSVGMGRLAEIAADGPGVSFRSDVAAPLARILTLNGYSTAQFGKCNEVPFRETTPIGPFDHWPTGAGFEHFYGFLGGEANQWRPTLYDGTAPVYIARRPEDGYHLMSDLADKAIAWVRQQRSLAPEKPFFIYFAPGATHAPHHVPGAWVDRYKGRFDDGWDELRQRTLRRQKQLGVTPRNCELTRRPKSVPAWDDMPGELKPILRRQMENYAGYLEFADHHVGRVIEALEGLDVLDDTLVFYILGDNGASAEGTLQGAFNQILHLNGMSHVESVEFLLKHIDDFGGPSSYAHYSMGWAHAMSTPFRGGKQQAAYFGGTRTGAIVAWSNGFRRRGEIRNQFHHVIDVAPTILDAARLPEPVSVGGVHQAPMEGVSMRYCFDDPRAAGRHETQYFEMLGSRGIYHQGWTAVASHVTPTPASGEKRPTFDDDVWELYDSTNDWAEARDVSPEFPEKLAQLERLWLIEAMKYHVLPLDADLRGRMNSVSADQPHLVRGTSQVVCAHMSRVPESALLNLKNRSHSVTAEIVVTNLPASGVLICQGGNTGGWSFYARDGHLKYCYNLGGIQYFHVETRRELAAGAHQVRMEFAYDGGGAGKGGYVTLFIDGREAARGRVEATLPMVYSASDGCEIARDAGPPVADDYPSAGNSFNGDVCTVTLTVKEASPEEWPESSHQRFELAMARQ